VLLAEAFIKAFALEGIMAVAGVSFVQEFVAVGLARDGIMAEAFAVGLASEDVMAVSFALKLLTAGVWSFLY